MASVKMTAYMSQTVDPSILSDYVRQKMKEGKFTSAEVRDRARRRGFYISESYIAKILQFAGGNLTIPKLQALAAGLGVSEDEIFDVARGVRRPKSYTTTDFYSLYEKTQRLKDAHHLRLVLDMVSMINEKAETYLEEEAGERPDMHGYQGAQVQESHGQYDDARKKRK